MKVVNKKYYDGFEGEPEISFVCQKEKICESLVIWEGYFDQIMSLIVPDKQGWDGMAYCYHMYTGWYEESPWVIEDLQNALRQLESIDSKKLVDESRDVWILICNIFREAILKGYKVFITRG